jgi:prefoldin alpha subunit
MVKDTSEEEIREKFTEFQTLQKHIEHLNEQVEAMNQQGMELQISKNAIEEAGKTDKGTEVLAPIANGIFIKTKLEENEKFIVNVGYDVTVEKSGKEVISLLEEQEGKIVKKISEASEILKNLQTRAAAIFKEVEEHVN